MTNSEVKTQHGNDGAAVDTGNSKSTVPNRVAARKASGMRRAGRRTALLSKVDSLGVPLAADVRAKPWHEPLPCAATLDQWAATIAKSIVAALHSAVRLARRI